MKSRNILISATLGVFFLSICLMLFFSLTRRQPLLDELDYWNLAKIFVEKGELLNESNEVSAYRPPIIPWLLSPLVSSGLDLRHARAIYTIFGIISVAGIWSIAHRLKFSKSQQLLAVILSGLNPVFVFTAASIYPQSILSLGYVVAILLLTMRITSFKSVIWTSLGMGAMFSLCLYASASSVFVFIPILAAYGWRLTHCSDGFRRSSLAAICGGCVCLILVGPYLFRNHIKVHPGAYLSLNSGINLLLGNSPDTGPNTGVYVSSVQKLQAAYRPLGEYASNKKLTEKAIENIKSNPCYYSILYFKKFLNGFNNSADTYNERDGSTKTLIAWSFYLCLVAGAAIGYRNLIRDHVELSVEQAVLLKLVFLIIAVVYIANIAGYSIFITRLRYRIPMDLLLALPAAWGYRILFNKLIGKLKIFERKS